MKGSDHAEIARHTRADQLERVAGTFLLAREAEHNLVLGICAGLRESDHDPSETYLASMHVGDRVVGAAVRTAPRNLVLSCVDDEAALEPLVEDVADACRELRGVLAPKAVAERFAELWVRRTGTLYDRGMAMRVHRVEQVAAPRGVPGAMREATADDAPLLSAWVHDFDREAIHGEGTREEAHREVERIMASPSGGMVVWVDDAPVSMAAFGGPTAHGVRIFAVYTPPELRGRGYATACVAALSQRLLDEGRRFCFLFTDLANPTSNAIYRRVGYTPVMDMDEMRFLPNPDGSG